MSDAQMLTDAARGAGYDVTVASARQQFAVSVLGVTDRALRNWLDGRRSLDKSPTVRRVCLAMLARPGLAGELARAGREL